LRESSVSAAEAAGTLKAAVATSTAGIARSTGVRAIEQLKIGFPFSEMPTASVGRGGPECKSFSLVLSAPKT
jgi:hypothetical protein